MFGLANKSDNIDVIDLINRYELNDKETWKDDIRPKLIDMFSKILDGTKYSLVNNTTDKSNKILELYSSESPKRIMGINQKREMTLKVFFNQDFYDYISKKVELPDNQKPDKSQPHMSISLETLYRIMSAISNE